MLFHARVLQLLVALTLASSALVVRPAVAASPAVTELRLDNGMQVVVIEDRRAPVVTHMVWYRVGAADDPPARSGLAHFLEHLMFKQTRLLASGELTRILTRLGARHNALTNHDTTSYFQRAAKEHLGRLMELEADRMTGLTLDDREVLTERDVIREERRSSVDASPIASLNEEMLALLYRNHTYGRPVLGWEHEMTALTRADVAAFYERWYGPDNAVLVVAGDVAPEEVRKLAEATYGRVARRHPPGHPALARNRPAEPPFLAPRSLVLDDERAGPSPLVLRYFQVPSLAVASPADGAALTLLARILGGDDTSRLYRRLVLELKLAVQAGADYQGGARDSGRLSLLALAATDVAPASLADAFDEMLTDMARNGPTEEELVRARRRSEADRVFEADNQEKLARRWGEAVTNGMPIAEIGRLDEHIAAATREDVRRAAATYLDARRSVTGVLRRPQQPAPATTARR